MKGEQCGYITGRGMEKRSLAGEAAGETRSHRYLGAKVKSLEGIL